MTGLAWGDLFPFWDQEVLVNVLRMLQTGGCFGVFYAPEAGAGASGQPQITSEPGDMPDTGDFGDPGDSDAGGDHQAAGGGDQDDDDDLLFGDDEPEQGRRRTVDEQIEALRRKNRKLRTRYGKAKPVLDRLKGVDIDRLIARATEADRLEAMLREPRSRFAGDGDREPRRPAEPALPSLPDQLTAETLGFDPEASTANRVLANTVAHVNRILKQVAQFQGVMPTVEQLRQSVVSDRSTRESQEWSGAMQSLEAELKQAGVGKFVRTAAMDAFRAAYRDRGQHRMSAKAIAQHYIGLMQQDGSITKKQAGQLTAGVQARMANHNRTLPRSPAGGGSPSSANGNQKPTLKDVHTRLKRYGLGGR